MTATRSKNRDRSSTSTLPAKRRTVDVTALSVDGEDVLGSARDSVGDNRFLYWPEALEYGTHKVSSSMRTMRRTTSSKA